MPMMEADGVRLHYHKKGKGIPIVLIHPPLLTSENFNYQLEDLSDDFQVIVFDIRGHGFSSPSEQAVTYSQVSSDIQLLLNSLDIDRCYIGGYSTGGGIALDAMLSYPHRFYGGIMISAMPEVSDASLRNRIRLAVRLSETRLHPLLRWSICRGNADMNLTYRNLSEAAKHGNPPNIRQYYESSLTFNCTKALKYLQLPQLLVYGNKDGAFHRYAKLLQAELPSSQLYYMRGVSHQLPTKAPRRLNGLIRKWITEHQEMGLSGSVLRTLERAESSPSLQ
ncbi:alpha/beta fold hydrolase [Marinicrinis sediminis]|uniref:Alpha/beta fold hydrolase n=1 Tax=Marinicrinis sediminis TaxID=1652465 RepID=A0ABW5R7U8_9BACL